MRLLFFFALIFTTSLSAQLPSSLDTLKMLYPDLPAEIIEMKIKNANNAHDFYRSFVRYYYHLLKNEEFNSMGLRPLEKSIGVVAGDPHVENFGFLINAKGEALGGINDFDDLSRGPIVHDLLRFLVSTKFALGEDFNQAQLELLLKNYEEGVQNKAHTYSPAWLKIMNKAREKGKKLSDKHVNSETKVFIKKKEVEQPITKEEIEAIKGLFTNPAFIKKTKNTYIVHDIYKRAKDSGGSAGIPRYEILATNGPNLQWVYFKKEIPSAVNAYRPNPLDNATKLRLLKDKVLNGKMPELYQMKHVDSTYLVRTEYDGNVGVEIKDLKKGDLPLVTLDEAYLLGVLHGRSLNTKQKITARKIYFPLSSAEWTLLIDSIAGAISNTYKGLKTL